MTKRFYVTMTWDNFPEGGSYGTIIECEHGNEAVTACRLEMAQCRADEDKENDAAYFLESYGEEWDLIDCWDLDAFIAEHARDTKAPCRVAPQIAAIPGMTPLGITPSAPAPESTPAPVKAADPLKPAPPSRNHWIEDPNYPAADWRTEAFNDDTRLGYLDWVASQKDSAEERAGDLLERPAEGGP